MRASTIVEILNVYIAEHGDCMVLMPCHGGQREITNIKFEKDIELEDVDAEGDKTVIFEDIFVCS